MVKYQSSKISIIDANRNKRSLEGKFSNQYLVAVSPIDSEGNFNHEPLKSRGYIFGGKNASIIGKMWVKPFDSIDDAEIESDVLCDGI